MISKQRQLFYQVGDQFFKNLVDAQKHDLLLLTKGMPEDWGDDCKKDLVDWVMTNQAAIIDTLTTTPRSRLKARKSHGGAVKPKKVKLQPAVVPEVEKPAAPTGRVEAEQAVMPV